MSNKAAWITGPKAKPLKVDDAPMPSPGPNEIVLRNYAVAINPVDWKMQDFDFFVDAYPTILGTDAAGEITAVGSSVSNFAVGDRVIAHLDGLATKKPTNSGFQLYSATTSKLVGKLPSSISYTDGVVLPLCLSTAAVSLFQSDCLALSYLQLTSSPKSQGKFVLVWGGSSAVGSCAIQLAKGAGFEVATTASSRNRDYCIEIGATYFFDYSKDSLVDDVVKELGGKELAGIFDAISSSQTLSKSVQLAQSLSGSKHVSTVLPPGMSLPEDVHVPDDVHVSHNFALSIADNKANDAVWGSWIPWALANGVLKCKPDPLVIGKGLEVLQAAVDKNREGVSASKVVVELP